MLRIAIAFVLVAFAGTAQGRTWSIAPDGSGDAPTIAAGIDSAAAQDTVLVACGTYFEHGLELKSSVMLRSITGAPECVRIHASRLGCAVVAVDVSLARIEGLTIAGGDGPPGHQNGGGGLHCRDSQLTITNCVFSGNISGVGGGIGCYSSSLVLEECRFESNNAQSPAWAAGGGLYCVESSPTLRNCTFVSNTAFSQDLPGDGGGIFSQSGSLQASDCTFINNSSGAGGGGMYSFSNDEPVLTRCRFSNNSSGSGGGMYLETSYASLMDCDFNRNTAPTGGAIFMAKWSYPEIMHCSFFRNDAVPLSGGAISCWESGPLIQQCSFQENTAGLDGGALFAAGFSSPRLEDCFLLRNSAASRGGAIRCRYAGQVDVVRSTIVQSAAVDGEIVTELSAPMSFTRTIIAWGSSGQAIVCEDASMVSLECCDVFGNAGGDWVGCIANQLGQDDNISSDPLFCSLSESNFALKPGSPCAPENSGACGLIGLYPADCPAVSAESIPLDSWGRIKGRYR